MIVQTKVQTWDDSTDKSTDLGRSTGGVHVHGAQFGVANGGVVLRVFANGEPMRAVRSVNGRGEIILCACSIFFSCAGSRLKICYA